MYASLVLSVSFLPHVDMGITYHAGTDGEGLDEFNLRGEDASVDLPVARVRGKFVAKPVNMI